MLKKDVYGRYLLHIESRKFDPKKIRQRNVHFGCIIPCMQLLVAAVVRIYTRRGLMRCLSLGRAMREPDMWDKRVITPTSFLYINDRLVWPYRELGGKKCIYTFNSNTIQQ